MRKDYLAGTRRNLRLGDNALQVIDSIMPHEESSAKRVFHASGSGSVQGAIARSSNRIAGRTSVGFIQWLSVLSVRCNLCILSSSFF